MNAYLVNYDNGMVVLVRCVLFVDLYSAFYWLLEVLLYCIQPISPDDVGWGSEAADALLEYLNPRPLAHFQLLSPSFHSLSQLHRKLAFL